MIYPLIIYNGDKPYAHSLNLSELIQPEASRKLFETLFIRPFCLIDLTTIADKSLRKAAQGRVKGITLLMALKHVRDKKIQLFFEQTLMSLLKQLDKAGDTDEVVDVLYYLLKESIFLDKKQFWAAFYPNFSREVESKMMTIEQQIRAEGMEKGVMQTAKRLLNEKTNLSEAELIAWVHRMTGLSIEKIQALKQTLH